MSGKEIYALVKELDVKDKYSLPIASGMKLVYDQNYKLKDILVDGVSIDLIRSIRFCFQIVRMYRILLWQVHGSVLCQNRINHQNQKII